ncbi:predicted GPI-anchored protein 57 [Ischnura elegans]|uniref:predicted GPI-anchored protein 57 n=1 Tax=Ischnura elegans TaxID=197161 RepID=UPI001ED8BF34|nr:predicted GPI-anchored protein 57 [Ischnura elegans]
MKLCILLFALCAVHFALSNPVPEAQNARLPRSSFLFPPHQRPHKVHGQRGGSLSGSRSESSSSSFSAGGFSGSASQSGSSSFSRGGGGVSGSSAGSSASSNSGSFGFGR